MLEKELKEIKARAFETATKVRVEARAKAALATILAAERAELVKVVNETAILETEEASVTSAAKDEARDADILGELFSGLEAFVSPEKHREIENEAHTFLTGLSLSEEEASANELEREESPPGDANRGVVMREESPHGEEDGIRGENEEREGKQRGSNEGRGESGAGKGATRPTIMVSGGTLVVQVTSAPTMDSEEAEARRVAEEAAKKKQNVEEVRNSFS